MKNEELTIEQKMNIYMGQGFNDAQLQEIRIGLEDELDVSFYARPDMPASEMMYIRKELYKRHIEERQQQAIEQNSNQDDNAATKALQRIKSRRELAYISIVLFAISVIAFIVFLTNL